LACAINCVCHAPRSRKVSRLRRVDEGCLQHGDGLESLLLGAVRSVGEQPCRVAMSSTCAETHHREEDPRMTTPPNSPERQNVCAPPQARSCQATQPNQVFRARCVCLTRDCPRWSALPPTARSRPRTRPRPAPANTTTHANTTSRSEHRHELAGSAFFARAPRVGAHVANRKPAPGLAGAVDERSVPQVVVKENGFARQSR